MNEQAVTRPHPSQTWPARSAPPERSAQVIAYLDVIHALCNLDQVDSAALRLIYWHGRTQAQVADELDIPIGIVRAAVARGMRHIAEKLTDQ